MKGHLQLAIGLGAGLLLGLLAAATQEPVLLWLAEALRPIGTVFINLLTMVVIPLVASSLFVGVAQLGDPAKLGQLGIRSLGFFWATTLVAILLGFLVAAVILPLGPLSVEQQTTLRAAAVADSAVIRPALTGEAVVGGARFIVELIPRNPLEVAARGALLPLIVFVVILAVATAALPAEKRQILTELADGVTQSLIKVVRWVLALAPIGVAALVAPPVAKFGLDLVASMAVFILAVAVGLGLLLGLALLPAARLMGRVPVGRFVQAITPSFAMGLSTTSSLATLPTMLDAAERDLKISRTVSSFVLPLAATLNRPGSALFQVVAVVFMAQLYGIAMGPEELIQAGASVFLASLTVASIPAASVVSLAPAFTAVGIPLTGLGLLIGLDRIPDMLRTATNVAGHLTGSVVVAASEGEHPS